MTELSATPESAAAARSPLSIAMISYYLPSDSKIGVGHQAHAMANAMSDRGHQVTMFSPCAKPDDAKYDLRHVALTGSNRTFRFAWAMRTAGLEQFDVIHAHGDDYWLWRRRASRHIRTLHGSCFSEALHINGIKERLRMLLLGLTEVLASIVADRAVVVSADTRRFYPWVKTLIPNGVDLDQFQPGQKAEHPTLLFVGTHARRKRGWLVAKVFQDEIRPRIPDARLIMICEDAPGGPGITVTGRISDAQLIEHYQRSWVFCLPSTYEGFGIPYVEAMACGTPVISTDNPGARYVLGDQQAGMIVNDASLGSTLVDLLSNNERRRAMSEAGPVRARTFSMIGVCEAYETVYTKR